MLRKLSEDFAVAPQIGPQDVATAAAKGYRLIVNNRPDGEDPSAPQGAAIEAAAHAAGLAYVAVPITHAGFSLPQVEALGRAMLNAPGPVLAYCRSGTRSAHLWALAKARDGAAPDGLIDAAAAAGYDLSGMRPTLEAFAAAGKTGQT